MRVSVILSVLCKYFDTYRNPFKTVTQSFAIPWLDGNQIFVCRCIRFQFAKWFLLLANCELQMKFKNFFGRNTFRKRKRRNQNDFSRLVAVYSLHKRELKHKKNQPCFWIILFVHFSIINFPLFFEETQELDFLVCFRTWQWSDQLSNLKLHAATWANFGLKEGFIQMGNGAILRRWTLSALCPIFSFIAQTTFGRLDEKWGYLDSAAVSDLLVQHGNSSSNRRFNPFRFFKTKKSFWKAQSHH